jgi:hypothetical protein
MAQLVPHDIWQEILGWLSPLNYTDLAAAMALCRTAHSLYICREGFLRGCNIDAQPLRVCAGERISELGCQHVGLRGSLHGLIRTGTYAWRLYEFGLFTEIIGRRCHECYAYVTRYYYTDRTVVAIATINFDRDTGVMSHIECTDQLTYSPDWEMPLPSISYNFKLVNGRSCIDRQLIGMDSIARMSRLIVPTLDNLPRLFKLHLTNPFWVAESPATDDTTPNTIVETQDTLEDITDIDI